MAISRHFCVGCFLSPVLLYQVCSSTTLLQVDDDDDDDDDLNKERKQDVLQAFCYQVRTSIVRDKNAFLLNELLEDIKILSDEQGLPFPAIEYTAMLKQKLIQEFEERISFFPSGKYMLVHQM